MGKKGVILDNGKAARSSMALYWNAAGKKKDHGEKKEAREEDIEERAGSNLDKWKEHKQKLINKLYDKSDKQQKVDRQTELEREQRQQEQIEREQLQKQMNKHKPVAIPGFKNMQQLRAKMHFETVKAGKNDNNKLIPRSPAQELTQEEIIQILREKKAKKELEKAQQERIEKNLQKRLVQEDLMMEGLIHDKKEKVEPPPQPPEPQLPPEPQYFFKSELLQKIERGEALHTKQEKVEPKVEEEAKPSPSAPSLNPRFVPRALWSK